MEESVLSENVFANTNYSQYLGEKATSSVRGQKCV